MRLYLAGPMRGIEDYNFNAFEAGKVFLLRQGHEVISPHDLDIQKGYVTCRIGAAGSAIRKFSNVETTDKFDIHLALRQDFMAICWAEGVAFLPGWENSSGSQAENTVRTLLGMPAFRVNPPEWDDNIEEWVPGEFYLIDDPLRGEAEEDLVAA